MFAILLRVYFLLCAEFFKVNFFKEFIQEYHHCQVKILETFCCVKSNCMLANFFMIFWLSADIFQY